jgi:hypothetical protein
VSSWEVSLNREAVPVVAVQRVFRSARTAPSRERSVAPAWPALRANWPALALI